LVENVVAEFQTVAHEASIKLHCQCLARPHVYADGQRLVQVIENFLSNAVKFSPSGSEVTVRVLINSSNLARLEVSDQGPGIAQQDMAKLFEKFQQLDSPDRRLRGGTGLGLSICKAIMEAHSGRVGVMSQEGQGSTFWLEMAVLP
jgi:signal transduction histidine kinase